jgi:hypothetical protein
MRFAWIAGVVAGSLPQRLWPTMDPYIPASDGAHVVAIAALLAAAAIGIPGFLRHAADQASANNRAILHASMDPRSRKTAETLSKSSVAAFSQETFVT